MQGISGISNGVKKIILAYSGGLDTSVCLDWLIKRGYEVITFTADLGQGINFNTLEKRAKAVGAKKVYIEDLKEKFVNNFALPALKANAVYESKYLLATALGRPLIAQRLVDIAHKENAQYIAHGCTGKGNDQVRIEVSVGALDPKLKIIAPLRQWEIKSRGEELSYAKKHKIPIDIPKNSPYSIDRNLWGVSIECGVLEDPDVEPPADVYQITANPQSAPAKPTYLEITFANGVPQKIDTKLFSPVKLVSKLNKIGAEFGIGRTDLVENRLIGIKSREVYEAPAATILHLAHRELESLVLDRELLHFKELISQKYAELIYYGLWYSPLKDALDKFVDQTQKKVNGTVKLKLYKGSCICVGRKSKYSLYKKELATYEAEDKFDKTAAEGFIKLWGLPYKNQK